MEALPTQNFASGRKGKLKIFASPSMICNIREAFVRLKLSHKVGLLAPPKQFGKFLSVIYMLGVFCSALSAEIVLGAGKNLSLFSETHRKFCLLLWESFATQP